MNLRTKLAIGVAVLLAVLLPSMIWFAIGPRFALGRGPKLAFLSEHTPVIRLPSVRGAPACDIYSFPATLEDIDRQIDATMPDLFEYRYTKYDGLGWSAAKDDSGLEISVQPLRSWKDKTGSTQTERRTDWVTVYVHYPVKPREEPSVEQHSIVGKWASTTKSSLGNGTIEFLADGTIRSFWADASRKRVTHTTGSWRIDDGILVYKSIKSKIETDQGIKEQLEGSVDRFPLIWLDANTFKWRGSENHMKRISSGQD